MVTACQGKQHGFSLLEIIVVMMLMALLTTSFIGRLMESDTELIAGVKTLKAHLRYARTKAMGTSSNWYVQFDTDPLPGTYTLHQADGTAKSFPGEEGTEISLQEGMAVPDGDGAAVNFDRLGRPYADTGGTTKQTAAREIVTTSSTAAGNVEIKPETGYIP